MTKHSALVVNNLYDLWVWRQPLIRALQDAGFQVVAVGPPGPWAEPLARLGCCVATYPVNRPGLNPLSEIRSLVSLYAIYRWWRPAIAHHFTIKPNFYGTLAARSAGVPVVVSTVTGLGYVWTDDGLKARLLRRILGSVYRGVLRLADAVIYLNEVDREILGGRRTVTIPGEGIDLTEFSPEAVPPDRRLALRRQLGLRPDVPVVLMAGRMIRHKGVFEFVEAVRQVRRICLDAVFLLVGPSDEGNPARVSMKKLWAWEAAGLVKYLGVRDNLRDLLAIADVVVLPSYREGLPRVLVEGAAMARPLVATDVPGCREVVKNGVNGFLVPPRDPVALAEVIVRLLKDSDLRGRFGAASRHLAEEQFSDQRVVTEILRLYAELLDMKGLPVPARFRRSVSEV